MVKAFSWYIVILKNDFAIDQGKPYLRSVVQYFLTIQRAHCSYSNMCLHGHLKIHVICLLHNNEQTVFMHNIISAAAITAG